MGIRASVRVVFGIDLGRRMPRDAVCRAADADGSAVEMTHVCGEAVERPCSLLFARGTRTELVYGYDVPVPVLDVATVGAGVDTAPMAEALRAFCETHGIPWSEPRWLIVSDVS